jgi:tetratricopeptide (TPR) repeat protein
MLSEIGRDEMTAETDYAPITFAQQVIAFLEPRVSSLAPLERAVLADAYFAAGRTDRYKQIWQQLFATSEFDTAKAHGNFAANLLKKNDAAAAIPHFRRAYELDPENLTYRRRYDQARNKAATQAAKSK